MKHLRIFAALLCLALLLTACASGAAPAGSGAAPDKPDTDGRTPADAPDGPDAPALPAAEGGKPEYGGFDGGVSFFSSSGKGGADSLAPSGSPGGAEADDAGGPGEPAAPGEPTPGEPASDPGEALVLTAAEWNDNQNWPFFTNLVNEGHVAFPSFGVDPRGRVEVRVTGEDGAALANETVVLLDAAGTALWTARTDRDGVAYVFFSEEQSPDRVVCGEASAPVNAPEPGGDGQGVRVMRPVETVALTAAPAAPAQTSLQVLFIVDTTGSMGDELAYLQKDFSAIAERVGSEGVTYAVSFYRDEGDVYVTRHSGFTSDVAAVQDRIAAEYADGGGDAPEAVAEVLHECLAERTDWAEDAAKVAFLIFDAPPHEGKESMLREAVQAAAEKGVRLVPVVASNAERETELFGRAVAICTGGTYVFLTDDSGVGGSHLEPIVGRYTVEKLQDLIVRIIERYR